ncbi:unnamed protein product [Chrysoparadoxa australica]
MVRCQYARCSDAAVFSFADETEPTYCDKHKAEGMVYRGPGAGEETKEEEPAADYYAALGVPKDATLAQIKRAYHKRALKAHPDKGGDPVEFKEISEAYAVLSDPAKRKAYDMGGEEGVKLGDMFAGQFPDGFTVVAARQVFAQEFGDAQAGGAQHFMEFEFMKQSVGGTQHPAKAPVQVTTLRQGNKTIVRTQMIYGEPPQIFVHEDITTRNADGTETKEVKRTVEKLSKAKMCATSLVGCLYLLTCGCGCNFGFNCCCNGCCGILPGCVTMLKHAQRQAGGAPTPERMDDRV